MAGGTVRLIVAGCLAAALAACGFQLRGSAELPAEMARTRLVIGDVHSPFARRVRVMLEQAGVALVSAERATAILEISRNDVVTEVLTIGDNARIREYRITHTVQFRVLRPNGGELIPLQTIREARDISFDEQQILAISREQEYIRQDLANTLSRLLLSRLEVVGSQS